MENSALKNAIAVLSQFVEEENKVEKSAPNLVAREGSLATRVTLLESQIEGILSNLSGYAPESKAPAEPSEPSEPSKTL